MQVPTEESIGVVIKPTTPDAAPPPGRMAHENPNGDVVWIVDSTTIASDSHVTIEADSQLGFGVMLSGNTTIAAKAEAGNNVEIVNSQLREGSRVGDGSIVVDSTVGERSRIGQGNEVWNATIGYDVVSGCNELITGAIKDETEIGIKVAV